MSQILSSEWVPGRVSQVSDQVGRIPTVAAMVFALTIAWCDNGEPKKTAPIFTPPPISAPTPVAPPPIVVPVIPPEPSLPEVPKEIQNLKLWSLERALFSALENMPIRKWDTYELEIPKITWETKLDSSLILNMYALIDRNNLQIFIDTLDIEKKAILLSWIDDYQKLATGAVLSDSAKIIAEAMLNSDMQNMSDLGPRYIAKYSKWKITPLQVRTYWFQQHYAKELPAMKTMFTDLQSMLRWATKQK
jgi:hypothetical protein